MARLHVGIELNIQRALAVSVVPGLAWRAVFFACRRAEQDADVALALANQVYGGGNGNVPRRVLRRDVAQFIADTNDGAIAVVALEKSLRALCATSHPERSSRLIPKACLKECLFFIIIQKALIPTEERTLQIAVTDTRAPS